MQLEIIINIHPEDGTAEPAPLSFWIGPTALDAVLFDFNPTTSTDVTITKALCAGVVQQMKQLIAKVEEAAKKRQAHIAITQIEIAQMCAVKAYFAK